MSLASIAVPIQYAGNGVTTIFAFPYKFTANTDLTVVTTVSDVDTTKTYAADYTVSGAGVDAGGSVTFITAPAAGVTVSIYRDVPETQSVDYVSQDNFPAETHEGALDRLAMFCQDLSARLARTMRFPRTNAAQAEITKLERASKFFAFDSDGEPVFLDGTESAPSDASLSLVTATGSTTARGLAARFGEVVNVKDFGAIGNGVADDTAAIQAAINYLQANRQNDRQTGLATGTVYFPRGVYLATTLALANAISLTFRGDGIFSSSLELNSATATFITATTWIGFYGRDMSFVNRSATAYTAQTSVLFSFLPNAGGTICHFQNCGFQNCADLILVGGTVNGDTFTFDQCRFSYAKNCFRTANTQAVIHKFTNCVVGNVSTAFINVTGTGMFHLDSCNFAMDGDVFRLISAGASYGANSCYTATNCKMEWTAANPQWIRCDSDLYPLANFQFLGCVLAGGVGANPALPTITLAGSVCVRWIGGSYAGTVKYNLNTTLETDTLIAQGYRTEIVFEGCRGAPDPDGLILTAAASNPSTATPVFVYRGCANMIDMEFGGLINQSFRTRNTMQYQSALNQVCAFTDPFDTNIDFFGRTVRIDAVYIKVGASTAGNKVVGIYSDAGYATLIGEVTFAGVGAGYYKLVLTTDPTIIVDKLYLRFNPPGVQSITGAWYIDYTVLA